MLRYKKCGEIKMGLAYKADKFQAHEKIYAVLSKIANKSTGEYNKTLRAKIALQALQQKTNKEIAENLRLHLNTTQKWKARFRNALPFLNKVAKNEPDELEDSINYVLSDSYRSGAPRKYDENIRDLIKLIACNEPSDYGLTAVTWSISLIWIVLIYAYNTDYVSLGFVANVLKTDKIKPWKSKYYLNSKDKYEDYEEYSRKINDVNQLYAKAKELRNSNNPEIRIYSVDEMTGIQALSRTAKTKKADENNPNLVEFNYKRNGTTTLIEGLDVITGKVSKPYLNSTRKEEDFAEAIMKLFEEQPDKPLHIIADNLNTHMSESLVRYISKVSGLSDYLGIKGKKGILKNMKTRTKFLSDPSHKIVFHFLPNHCSWANQIEIFFSIMTRKIIKNCDYSSVKSLEDAIKKFCEQHNQFFARPYEWNYNKVPDQRLACKYKSSIEFPKVSVD